MPKLSPREFADLHKLTPEAAVEFLRKRRQLAQTFDWRDLWQEEHAIQFTVSRLANLDILRAMQEGLEKAVAGDLSRRDWTKNIEALLKSSGWWGKKQVLDPATGEVVETTFNSARLDLIFDVNTRQAYAAGHWQQAVAGKRAFPYLRYVTKRDARVRDQHAEWEGLTLSIEDKFWQQCYPPNGYRCRCSVISVSAADYQRGTYQTGLAPGLEGRRRGQEGARQVATRPMKKTAPKLREVTFVNRRTGEVTTGPAGVQPAFAYNVGIASMRQAALAEAAGQKIAAASAPLGAAFGATLPARELAPAFGDFFDAALANRARATGKTMVVGVMRPEWVEAATKAGVAPGSAEIAIRDRDIAHMFRDGKVDPLPQDWVRKIPAHLKNPQAVILDQTHADEPALLLVFDAPTATKKLVVRINYKVRKAGTMNIVETGRLIGETESLRGSGYTLIEGKL